MASSQNLTDYERKRLENIRRNHEMMTSLKLHSKATELFKRPGIATPSEKKKPQFEIPVPTRRSLRSRGMPPDPLKITSFDSYSGIHSDASFIESIVGMAHNETSEEKREMGSLKLESLSLESKNIARVVYGRITAMKFFPSTTGKMIVAGNNVGNIGFWNVGEIDAIDGEPWVYSYNPHSALISGILVHPYCLSKIYTSCYDGLIRLMDAEKEILDLVFNNNGERIQALSQPKNEANCIYVGEGRGGLTLWDNRIGKCSCHQVLHKDKINTIDFNCENPHIVATSSSDRTACTWDLRYIGKDKLTPVRKFTHIKGVQSAYFSPSGCSLATTSMGNTICVYSGVNLEDAASIYHENAVIWISTCRAIWGWDDSYLFVGNIKGGVDVVSPVQKKTVMTLQSPYISATPCRFDAHPYEVGTLAVATSEGQAYIWTSH